MALKLDMAKAYDRVEWCFIKRMMEQLGFDSRFISLIMDCITTVSYSIICQGKVEGHIIPERGIRQGDPLSPYIFLLCTEGFTHLIKKAELYNKIQGIKVAHGEPSITHFFFADDSLLFLKATQ